jgi:uncharacterized protein (TIGR04255 family)
VKKNLSKYTVFPNAPIVEAVLDIRVELPEKVELKDLETFQNSIKKRFPEKKLRHSVEARLRFSPEEGPATLPILSKPLGYLFNSPTDKKVVQARLDGFTFSKLKPYEKWEAFRNEGRELWRLYTKVTKPTKIVRIALRYINRIEIPLPLKEFKEYIFTIPQMPDALPQTVSHFFLRFIVPKTEIEANAIITLTLEKPADDKKLPLIFDIDVFRAAVFVDNKEEIWGDFEKLRLFKNDIFFKSITDKTKELFK